MIEIFDDSNPYPMLLGIDWATDMNGVINLKKHKMIFEKMPICVVVPLDPIEGSCYMELVHDYDRENDMDCIYKITTWEQDWVNPIADGQISWEREISCTSHSERRDRTMEELVTRGNHAQL